MLSPSDLYEYVKYLKRAGLAAERPELTLWQSISMMRHTDEPAQPIEDDAAHREGQQGTFPRNKKSDARVDNSLNENY